MYWPPKSCLRFVPSQLWEHGQGGPQEAGDGQGGPQKSGNGQGGPQRLGMGRKDLARSAGTPRLGSDGVR